MPSFTDLKELFSAKYATLSEPQQKKPVYNPDDNSKALTWEDIRALVTDNNLECLAALQALYRAGIIRKKK